MAHGERLLDPLHRAPWLDEPEVQLDESLVPIERGLSGDFLCAPFGSDGRLAPPPHGWTANSPWEPIPHEDELRLVLKRRVFGATVTKRLRLADGPFLIQEHRLIGGAGATTLAHHPMIRLHSKGRLSASPKRLLVTPEAPLEPRHALAYPAEATRLEAAPGRSGPTRCHAPTADLDHEDFLTMVEAEDSPLGWTAVVREAEDDVVFILKDPALLPITMLWFSNGGRDYSPWNGRPPRGHRG